MITVTATNNELVIASELTIPRSKLTSHLAFRFTLSKNPFANRTISTRKIAMTSSDSTNLSQQETHAKAIRLPHHCSPE